MMDNVIRKIEHEELNEQSVEEKSRSTRARKGTLLKLQWLAERLRKVERIKKQLAADTYHVDSHDVAKALIGLEEE